MVGGITVLVTLLVLTSPHTDRRAPHVRPVAGLWIVAALLAVILVVVSVTT